MCLNVTSPGYVGQLELFSCFSLCDTCVCVFLDIASKYRQTIDSRSVVLLCVTFSSWSANCLINTVAFWAPSIYPAPHSASLEPSKRQSPIPVFEYFVYFIFIFFGGGGWACEARNPKVKRWADQAHSPFDVHIPWEPSIEASHQGVERGVASWRFCEEFATRGRRCFADAIGNETWNESGDSRIQETTSKGWSVYRGHSHIANHQAIPS